MTQSNSGDLDNGSAVALVEDLTRRTEAASAPEAYALEPETSIISRVLRNDERIDHHNLEKWLPEPTRLRGTATVFDPSDFITYVRRLGDSSTTVWGDEDTATFTAVFNDHTDNLMAGWRDHTARLALKDDPDWTAFLAKDGRWFTQVNFAEFLQDYQATFVEPDGATLLEIATSFKAHRKAEYSSAVNLDNGDVSLTYSETTTAKATKSGQIEVPSTFVVKLSPFLGMPPVKLGARLKWNLDDGVLQIGFRLVRADLVKRDAFAGICADIRTGLETTDSGSSQLAVLLGVPPKTVTPQQ